MQTPSTLPGRRPQLVTRDTMRYRLQHWAGVFLAYGLLVLLSLFIFLPLGWMAAAALKPDNVSVFTLPPQWFPTEHWRWENFPRALSAPLSPFGRYTLNTLFLVAMNMAGALLSCSMVAFAFARLRFRGRDLLFNILIITMLIPWQVLMIPQFLMFHSIGWYGTYLPLIVPSFMGNAFYIFLIRQYMMTFPRDLDDAARIDGAGYWQIYLRIILPLSKPVLVVCAVFVLQAVWGDLLGPLIYLDENNKFTIAIGLANMVSRASRDWNLLMAANLMAVTPLVIVYFFAQEQLIGGISSLGLKG